MRRRRWTFAASSRGRGGDRRRGGAGDGRIEPGAGADEGHAPVKWVVQSQFAGYYAAKAKGYYKQVGLDVNIKAGGPDILPEQVVLGKQAEFGINWMPSLLAQRDPGNDLVNIAQVYARSGTTEVTFKSSGINTFKKMRGKKFGVWIFGNEFEQRAALVKNGMNPDKDVTLVKQNFDMLAFLSGEIDAASAMTYNELAQVLEVEEPGHGQALQALRSERLQVLGPRHGDAPGRRHRPRRLDQGRGEPGDRGQVPRGVVPAGGSTAVTTSPSARTSC